jgi:hypothetical protein
MEQWPKRSASPNGVPKPFDPDATCDKSDYDVLKRLDHHWTTNSTQAGTVPKPTTSTGPPANTHGIHYYGGTLNAPYVLPRPFHTHKLSPIILVRTY